MRRTRKRKGGTIGKHRPSYKSPFSGKHYVRNTTTPAAFIIDDREYELNPVYDATARIPGPYQGMDYEWGNYRYNGKTGHGWYISKDKNNTRLASERAQREADLRYVPEGPTPDESFFDEFMN
jgi:hypothetical protein